jgi:hypothetical protein
VASIITPTPTEPLSDIGKVVLGPVPIPRGGNVYLFPDKPINAATLEIFDLIGEIEARVTYIGSDQLVWNTGNIAPGVYMAIIKVDYTDGTTGTTTQKIVVSR